jgi:hypothetical protein
MGRIVGGFLELPENGARPISSNKLSQCFHLAGWAESGPYRNAVN